MPKMTKPCCSTKIALKIGIMFLTLVSRFYCLFVRFMVCVVSPLGTIYAQGTARARSAVRYGGSLHRQNLL